MLIIELKAVLLGGALITLGSVDRVESTRIVKNSNVEHPTFSPIFAIKNAEPLHSNGNLLALPANIRLGWK